MKKSRFAIAAGFSLLCAAPGLTRLQSSPASPVQDPHSARPAVRPHEDTPPTDDFAGLQLTNDQKAKIDQIHQDMKSRMDVLAKNEKLTADQKGAFLEGYRRMENSQVFAVLTPEQQKEVRKRMLARRAAEQAEKKKQPPPN
ncbi:MAG TPA: hypothetical protein VMR90_16370 [Candidatus Cybelea sp.]|nr:hypothetical protein [Candidatus Cybelea sp.]